MESTMNAISRSTLSNKNQSCTSTMSKSLTETSNATMPTHLLPGYQGTTTSKPPAKQWTPQNGNRAHGCTQASPQPEMVRVFHSGVAIDYHKSPQITSVLWPIYKDNGEFSVVAQDGPWRGTAPTTIPTGATSWPVTSGLTWGRINNEPNDKAVSQQKDPLDAAVKFQASNVPNGPQEQPKMPSDEDAHEGKKKMDSIQMRRHGNRDNFKRADMNVLEVLQNGSDMQLKEVKKDNSNIKITPVKVQAGKESCIENFENSKKCDKVVGTSQAQVPSTSRTENGQIREKANSELEKQNADARKEPKVTTSSTFNTPQGVLKTVTALRGNNMQTSQELESAVTSEGSSNRRPAEREQLMCDRQDARETVKDLIVRIREIQSRLLHTESEDRKKRMLKVILLLQRKIKALTEGKKKAKTDAAKQQEPLNDSSSLLKEPIKEERTDSDKKRSVGSTDSHSRNFHAASVQNTTSRTLEVGYPGKTTETIAEGEGKGSGNISAFHITESQMDPALYHPPTALKEACGKEKLAAVEIKGESFCYVHGQNLDGHKDSQAIKTCYDDSDNATYGQQAVSTWYELRVRSNTSIGRPGIDPCHSVSTDNEITVNNAPLDDVELATQNEDTVTSAFGDAATPGEEQVVLLENGIQPTKEKRNITKDEKDLTSHVINTTQNDATIRQSERDVRIVTLSDQQSSCCLVFGEEAQDERKTQEENIAPENREGFGSLHDFNQASVSNMTANENHNNATEEPELNSSPQGMMGDSSLDTSDEDSIITAEHCDSLSRINSVDIDLQGFTSPSIYNPSGRSEDVDLAQSLQIREARILKLRQMKERILANVSRITRYADQRMQNI